MPLPLRQLYLVKDKKSLMLSLVRFVQTEELDSPRGGVDFERANALLMARDPEALVESALKLGPMFVREADLGDRCLSLTQSGRKERKRFRRSDSAELLAECFFDPYTVSVEDRSIMFEGMGRTPRASADRVVEKRDYLSECPDLSSLGDGFRLIVEPLQDWVLLRNLLSIALRLGGTLRASKSPETLLDDAGFAKSERKTLYSMLATDSPGFTIPVMFNPFFREGTIVLRDFAYDADAAWPLFRSITETKSRYLGLANVASLRGCDSIKFVTGPQAEASEGGFRPIYTRPEESRWMYLVIENREGLSQKELADMFLDSLDRCLYRPHLSYGDNPMAEVSVNFYDLPSALWDLVRSHQNHYLMTCDNCHRTVFSTTQGPNRRFCSDSCRVTWGKRH